MTDPGDALSLLRAGGRHESARCGKQDAPPDAGLHGFEDMPAQHGRTAAAAGSPRVNLLGGEIINEHAAVHIPRSEGNAVRV